MSPLLSVVVPFYNVEAYLEPCLESLARQTLSDLEVIMVDDGSTDSSATIAKNFAAKDGRFRLVQQQNQGLGPARNAGVPHSAGRFLAFADSDDIIPRYAYELMVASLEETGSDLACGGVRRFGVNGLTQSPMHRKIFQIDRKATHVSEFPELLNDRTAWNKVFRRAFWDKHSFAFPAGLYEDIPVTIPAHVLAAKVDVLHEAVYHWRIRESGARSITQRRTEPGNLADRMRSVTSASTFLAENAPELKDRYDHFALADDIRIFLNVVDQGDELYRETFFDLVNGVLDRMDPHVYDDLPAIDRLKFHAVRQRLMPELVEIVSFAKSHPDRGSAIQLPEHPGKWFGDYPYLGDPRFPTSLYELRDELQLKTGIDDIRWRDGRLRIEGHAYIDRMHVPNESDATIEIELRRRRLLLKSKVLRPDVERMRRPDVTAESKQATADLSGSGFAFEVTPEQLGSGEGTWHVYVTVSAHGVSRHDRLTGPKGAGLWPPLHETSPGKLIKPKYSQAGELLIGVQSVRAKVTSISVDGTRLLLTGWVRREDAACVTNGHLEIALRQGMVKVKQPVRKTGTGDGGRVEFAAELDITELAAQTEAGDSAETGDSIDWDVSLRTKGTTLRLAVEADLVDLRAGVAGREYDVIATKYGNLTLVERAPRLVVTGTRWLDGSTIELTGSSADERNRPDRLILRMRRSTLATEVPLTWDGPRFTAQLDGRSGGLPLSSGRWDLYAPGERGDLTVGIDRGARGALPEPHFVGMHELVLKAHRGDLLHLFVRRALTDDERGPYAQRRMQRALYGAANTAPIRDVVVFESYFGKQYSDNPQAIYEEMVRRDLPFEYVWGSNDGQFTVPVGDARTVLRGSRDYHELVASARFVVDNCLKPSGYAKRPGQVYLQTWHGTPYKHIAYDLVRNGRIASNTTKLSRYEEDVPLWDRLISPSPHVTGMLRDAFRYEGEVLEVGYPRNDMLFAHDADARERRVRDRLGIPYDRPVALYVPTWREDIWLTGGRTAELVLPADQIAASLGDSWAVLVRQHHMVADRTVGIGDGVVDVTRYPDISELYLIADVVITDYSSVMFDFAATGRPILFYVPDLDFYQDELRGTYFDLTAEAPGPLLREPDEVLEALRDIDATSRRHSSAYAAFRQKYCAMDDGLASQRVVDHLLSLRTD